MPDDKPAIDPHKPINERALADLVRPKERVGAPPVKPRKSQRSGKAIRFASRMRLRRRKVDLYSLAAFAAFVLLLVGTWRFASHATHLAAGVAVFGAIMSVAIRAFYPSLGWLAVALLLIWPYGWNFSPLPPSRMAEGCHLTVVSFNTKLTRGPTEEAIAAALAKTPADVILLQEAVRADALVAALRRQPAFASHRPFVDGDGNLAVWTRFPVAPAESTRWMRVASITVEGQPIRVTTGRAPKEFDDASVIDDFFAQVDRLGGMPGGPLIVGADLNAGPRSQRIITLATRFMDAHHEAGFGFGSTFPAGGRLLGLFGPFLRIDYVLSSGPLLPIASRVGPDHGGSTHYPVQATLVVSGRGANARPCNP